MSCRSSREKPEEPEGLPKVHGDAQKAQDRPQALRTDQFRTRYFLDNPPRAAPLLEQAGPASETLVGAPHRDSSRSPPAAGCWPASRRRGS